MVSLVYAQITHLQNHLIDYGDKTYTYHYRVCHVDELSTSHVKLLNSLTQTEVFNMKTNVLNEFGAKTDL